MVPRNRREGRQEGRRRKQKYEMLPSLCIHTDRVVYTRFKTIPFKTVPGVEVDIIPGESASFRENYLRIVWDPIFRS